MSAKKRVIIPLFVTVLLLAVFVGVWMYILQNDYVFKINGQKVTMNEFNPYLVLQKKLMEEEDENGENIWNMLINDAPAIETARNNAKQSIVDTVVKVQEAKARKLSLTHEEKEQIRTAVEYYTDILTDYGITKEEFVKINEDALLIDKLSVAVYNETDHSTHTHGKIDLESYEKNVESPNALVFSSRHILFSTQGMPEAEAAKVKAKAEAVLKRVKAGEDFAKLAGEYSEDPGSKDNGGLYENITSGSFVSEYENAVLSLKDGEIYPELVKSSHGYNIIKLESIKNPEGYLGLAAAQNVIVSEFNEISNKWVEEAVVEVNEQNYNSAQ